MGDARVILLKPGDLLLIGNTGVIEPEAMQAAAPQIAALKDTLGLAGIAVFEGDIDLAAVTTATRLDTSEDAGT